MRQPNNDANPASLKERTMPPPASHTFTEYITIPNDEHSCRAMETVCFERKFHCQKMAYKMGGVLPPDGHVFYEVRFTDPKQLFWLGTAWQSILTQ